jgi:VIT1/CCC1 family predicted Fe2+/Mn2+ transporter
MTDPSEPAPSTSARDAPGWSHHHRDVSGGWLRPTVFGAMDGLITNASLIIGVGGGGAPVRTLLLTGLAGLAAGSLSMAAGEYISVTSQNELIAAETAIEEDKLARFPDAEQEELTETLVGYGLNPTLAAQAATDISRDPKAALRMHTREEFGLDPDNLPSPWVAAAASLAAFAVGAIIPLLPYLAGARTVLVSLIVVAIALFAGGAVVATLTRRPAARGGARQLLLGALAAAITYSIGRLIGTSVT